MCKNLAQPCAQRTVPVPFTCPPFLFLCCRILEDRDSAPIESGRGSLHGRGEPCLSLNFGCWREAGAKGY